MLKEVAVTLCFIALTQAAASCPKNACDKITCGDKLTKDSCLLNGGRYIPNGGPCGCCDHCVQLLGEGEACTSSGPGLATSECGDNLYCPDTTNQCTKPNCAMIKKEKEEFLATVPKPPGFIVPTCDADGTYAGKQCSENECYCVDVHGKLIDGYSHGVSETDDRITCQCARDKSAYFKLGIIGRLFHCTEHGDYENVQCHGSVCYCADRKTGKQIDGTGIHISAKSKLDC